MRKNSVNVNLLELTPVAKYSHQVNSDGLIDVLVPRFKGSIMQKFVPKSKSKFIRANLDVIGTEVWRLIDGKRKVSDIAIAIDEKLGEKVQPVYDRLNVFLTQLHNNGFIYFLELNKEKKNG